MMMMRLALIDSPASSIPDYFSYSAFDWLNAYLGLVGECKPEVIATVVCKRSVPVKYSGICD